MLGGETFPRFRMRPKKKNPGESSLELRDREARSIIDGGVSLIVCNEEQYPGALSSGLIGRADD